MSCTLTLKAEAHTRIVLPYGVAEIPSPPLPYMLMEAEALSNTGLKSKAKQLQLPTPVNLYKWTQ